MAFEAYSESKCFIKDLAPDGTIFVSLLIRLMAPNGAMWSRDQINVIPSSLQVAIERPLKDNNTCDPLFNGFMIPDNCLPLQSMLIFISLGHHLYSESMSGPPGFLVSCRLSLIS